MRAARAVAPALLALVLLAGCGGSGLGGSDTTTTTTEVATPAKQSQRVIVETSNDGFDATKVYREAAPGVDRVRRR